jgi:hypothetical protein
MRKHPLPVQRFEELIETIPGDARAAVLAALARLLESVLYHHAPTESDKAPNPANAALPRALEDILNRTWAKAQENAGPPANSHPQSPSATTATGQPAPADTASGHRRT